MGGSQQMASAAPVSAVQSSPLSAPIQSAPLSAPSAAPARAAAQQTPYHPPVSQPVVMQQAPVRAAAQVAPPMQAAKPVAAAPAMMKQPEKMAAVAPAKPAKAEPVTNVAKSEAPAKVAKTPGASPVRTASLEPQTNAKNDATPVAPTAPVAAAPAPAPAAAAAAAEDASPEFRWPARGRVIQGFKAGSSEGINIAVPEGTAVKAAEGGTVAYAGSELKGYGNLVLIRHPNGFVSAYANNGELMVKRGETVTRGQVVAKSGQSGNVTSPQLHFELRKGATPVDPTKYLAGL